MKTRSAVVLVCYLTRIGKVTQEDLNVFFRDLNVSFVPEVAHHNSH